MNIIRLQIKSPKVIRQTITFPLCCVFTVYSVFFFFGLFYLVPPSLRQFGWHIHMIYMPSRHLSTCKLFRLPTPLPSLSHTRTQFRYYLPLSRLPDFFCLICNILVSSFIRLLVADITIWYKSIQSRACIRLLNFSVSLFHVAVSLAQSMHNPIRLILNAIRDFIWKTNKFTHTHTPAVCM